MLFEIGPIRPFAPVYGLIPTMTMKYTFQIDISGNLLIQSQLTCHPHKQDPIVHPWIAEGEVKDNIKIPNEMLSLIYSLLDESDSYFITHWTFVIHMIHQVKLRSSDLYNHTCLPYEKIKEEVDVLTIQKDQLVRRLRVYEPQHN